jgi:hypothetical protein
MGPTRGTAGKVRRLFDDYVAGADSKAFRRLFDREAAEVYSVLTRDQPGEEPEESFARLRHRVVALFLGLSFKLSPARRVLFAVSLLAALLGLVSPPDVTFDTDGGTHVQLEFSPLLFLAAIGGLVYLLAVELVDRVRFRDELELARQLQRDLLPRDSPELPGYAFAHSYRTANTIGGDYHDFLPLPDGRLGIVVGDASGHGISAGLLMAIAGASLKSALDLDPTPASVLEFLNRALYRTADRRAFMTACFGVLDPRACRFDFACAGHPFPLLVGADGAVRELGGAGSLPLGIRSAIEIRSCAVALAAGDRLLLTTDGLVEALDAEQRAFGFEGLAAAAAGAGSAQVVHDRVLAAFDRHLAGQPLSDDLTLVVVERR